MTEIVTGREPAEAGGALAVGVHADRVWGPGADLVPGLVAGEHDALLDAADFSGKLGQVLALSTAGGTFTTCYLVGLGEELDTESLRRAAGWLGAATRRVPEVATTIHGVGLDGGTGAVVEGFLLGQYRFGEYKSDDEPAGTGRLVLLGPADPVEARRGEVVAGGVAVARDLVNRPARDKSPATIATHAESFASELGLEFRSWSGDETAAAGFGGLAGVNAGAERPAHMVELRYGHPDATMTLALVGKGIVFDSGGLSLKSPDQMMTMKTDMSGAAAVLGAVEAIARLGIAVNVLAITPLTENLPSGSATRPGDVLTARNGKTMEVLNTDAEGRLVLADGLALAAEAEPDLIVDLATLTGACRVALGDKIGGVFSGDDEAAAMVLAAAGRSGERLWRMPLPDDYRKLIDSDVADIKNTGGRYGGAITAALFLREFAGDGPWVHVDMAGPAWVLEAEHYTPKGAAGFGVRTLVALAEELAATSTH